jgi:hypothetical protein
MAAKGFRLSASASLISEGGGGGRGGEGNELCNEITMK